MFAFKYHENNVKMKNLKKKQAFVFFKQTVISHFLLFDFAVKYDSGLFLTGL